jgi:hypothetical protein
MIASTNTDAGWLVGRSGSKAYSNVSILGVHATGGVLPPGATIESTNTVVLQVHPVMQTREGHKAGASYGDTLTRGSLQPNPKLSTWLLLAQ